MSSEYVDRVLLALRARPRLLYGVLRGLSEERLAGPWERSRGTDWVRRGPGGEIVAGVYSGFGGWDWQVGNSMLVAEVTEQAAKDGADRLLLEVGWDLLNEPVELPSGLREAPKETGALGFWYNRADSSLVRVDIRACVRARISPMGGEVWKWEIYDQGGNLVRNDRATSVVSAQAIADRALEGLGWVLAHENLGSRGRGAV